MSVVAAVVVVAAAAVVVVKKKLDRRGATNFGALTYQPDGGGLWGSQPSEKILDFLRIIKSASFLGHYFSTEIINEPPAPHRRLKDCPDSWVSFTICSPPSLGLALTQLLTKTTTHNTSNNFDLALNHLVPGCAAVVSPKTSPHNGLERE